MNSATSAPGTVDAAEEGLRLKDQILAAQLDLSIDGIVVVDEDGQMVSTNRRFAEMWGLPADIIESRSDERALQSVMDKLVHPEEFIAKVRYLYAHPGETCRDEVALKDGRTFDRYSAAMLGPDGNYYGRVWYFRDISERKQAEVALRTSAARLDLAVSAAQIGVWYLDIPKQRLTFDAQTCRTLGLDPALFTGTEAEFFAIMHPEDQNRIGAAVRRTLETGAPYETEYRVVWPDGSVHDICSRGAVAHDDAGRPVQFDGVLWDVTLRKRATETAERIRAGFQKGAVPQALVSLDGRFLEVNQALARLLGYPPAELVGKPFNEVTHPDDRTVGADALCALLSTGEALRFEKRYLTQDGATVWVDINVAMVRDADAQPRYFVGTYADITDRKQTEAALQETNRRFERLFRHNPALIGLSKISDKRFEDVNDAFLKTLGYSRAEVVGKTGAEIDLYPHPDQVTAMVNEVRAKASIADVDLQLRRKDGSIIECLLSGEIINSRGQQCFLTVALDITDRKQAERYRHLSIEVLGALNEPGGTEAVVGSILAAIKRETGFDAVGIRLRSGDDFPYFVQKGFSANFLITENTLVVRDKNGGACKDSKGKLGLECTCGMVLSGKAGPPNPFLTEGGSFWTNNVLPLLDLPAHQDPRLHPRNKCIHQGYSSLALIPVRANQEIVGLLQLNDRRKDRFTPESIRFFEGLSASIGVALTRKQQVDALHESRRRLGLALGAADMGVWHWDLADDIRHFDDQTCALLGLSPAEFRGTAGEFFATIHPEDREVVKVALARTIEQGEPYEPEYRVVWPDGSLHHISARGRLVRDETEEPIRIDGVVWDQTERARARQALQESEERFRHLAEIFPETIFECDLAGKVTYANQHGLLRFGLTQADIEKGFSLLQMICPEDRAAVQARMQARMRGESSRFLEIRAMHKNGDLFDAMAYASAMFQQGRVVGLRGFVLDISERKEVERKTRSANELLKNAMNLTRQTAVQAEQASAAKSAFLANMSHEIRTPLNGVIGMTGLLLDTELTPDQRCYAQTVRASGESLLALINDILDFSKIEAGKLALEVLDFDLRALLDDFAAMMALRAEEKQIEIICSVSPEVPSLLRGDQGRLRQVLVNLVGNALKFTSRGEVTVRVRVKQETETDVVLHFAVRDTGIGIPADKIGLLFNKFAQVDTSTTRRYGGTGLGLAISKQLSELMGGVIGVESEVGRGSEFWFTARFKKQPPGETALRRLPSRVTGARVLVVDDNPQSREAIVSNLAAWGVRPQPAADGPIAVRLLYQALDMGDPFRVVFTDMEMPGMNGEALGRLVAGEPRFAETKLVILTPLGRRGAARQFAEAGFSAHLVKPVRQSELFDCLANLLGEQRLSECERPVPARPRELQRTNVRVLLVEDNITNQKVALGILGKLGLRVDAVANGREAVEALRSISYDLVLMDVQMPEMDGLEATRAVRAAGDATLNSKIPIIAMTAHAMQGDRERCIAAGMDDYIAKPVTPASLATILDKWLATLGTATAGDEESGAGRSAESAPAANARAPDFDEPGMLQRLMGDTELARIVTRGFLEDIPKQLVALRGFVNAGDAKAAERQVHTIKGAAAAVSGESLAKLASTLELAGKAGDLATVKAALGDLQDGFARLKRAIEASTLLGAPKDKE